MGKLSDSFKAEIYNDLTFHPKYEILLKGFSHYGLLIM